MDQNTDGLSGSLAESMHVVVILRLYTHCAVRSVVYLAMPQAYMYVTKREEFIGQPSRI
jgi:hypothetical protein